MKNKIQDLAEACHNGACNPHGLIKSLGDAISDIPFGQARNSVELKYVLGHLSYLVGEALGPSSAVVEAYSALLEKEAQTQERAWELYCAETHGDLDVRDNWDDLPERVQNIYLEKVKTQVTSSSVQSTS